MLFDEISGKFVSRAVQQDTSMSAIMRNGLDVPSANAVFSEAEPVHVFRDFDALYQDYDPISIAKQREIDEIAQSMSKLNSDDNNGTISTVS